jgi:hypothetical protein
VIGAGQEIFQAEFSTVIGGGLPLERRISGMNDDLRQRNSGAGGIFDSAAERAAGILRGRLQREKEQR